MFCTRSVCSTFTQHVSPFHHPHLCPYELRSSTVTLSCGWPVEALPAGHAPLPVETLVGQAMSQSCPPGPSVPSVQEAAWARQWSHDHTAAEGHLGAGQVLTQETLDG